MALPDIQTSGHYGRAFFFTYQSLPNRVVWDENPRGCYNGKPLIKPKKKAANKN